MSNLPAIADPKNFAARIGASRQRVSTEFGGYLFLRLQKDGEWVYGPDDIEVQEGSVWAINPMSFVEGFCSWGDKINPGLKGEEMRPMLEGAPVLASELPDTGFPWKKQIGVVLACTNGDDKGTQVMYKTSSVGGMRAIEALMAALEKQANEDPEHLVPIVTLGADSYKHREYGKIYTPEITITAWLAFDEVELPEGDEEANETEANETEAEPDDGPAPAPKTRKRRRIAAE